MRRFVGWSLLVLAGALDVDRTPTELLLERLKRDAIEPEPTLAARVSAGVNAVLEPYFPDIPDPEEGVQVAVTAAGRFDRLGMALVQDAAVARLEEDRAHESVRDKPDVVYVDMRWQPAYIRAHTTCNFKEGDSGSRECLPWGCEKLFLDEQGAEGMPKECVEGEKRGADVCWPSEYRSDQATRDVCGGDGGYQCFPATVFGGSPPHQQAYVAATAVLESNFDHCEHGYCSTPLKFEPEGQKYPQMQTPRFLASSVRKCVSAFVEKHPFHEVDASRQLLPVPKVDADHAQAVIADAPEAEDLPEKPKKKAKKKRPKPEPEEEEAAAKPARGAAAALALLAAAL